MDRHVPHLTHPPLVIAIIVRRGGLTAGAVKG
jgi:hypothetical protein